jgi:hypothetical protein
MALSTVDRFARWSDHPWAPFSPWWQILPVEHWYFPWYFPQTNQRLHSKNKHTANTKPEEIITAMSKSVL